MAVEIERPRRRGERYVAEALSIGDLHSRRSDVIVMSTSTGEFIWSTRGAEKGESAFLPMWSPDGGSIAYLVTGMAGAATLRVWLRGTGESASLAAFAVNLTVPMRSDIVSTGEGAPFAWLDNERILVVARGDQSVAPLGPERLEAMGQRWRKTWSGDPSVDFLSNDNRPICGDQDRLVQLNRNRPGFAETLAIGAVKGVSIARDSSTAYIVGTKRADIPSRSPLTFPPFRNAPDLDQFVRWEVILIPPAGATGSTTVTTEGEGPLSAATLPQWSLDAKRLSGVTVAIDVTGGIRAGGFLWDRSKHSTVHYASETIADARRTALGFVSYYKNTRLDAEQSGYRRPLLGDLVVQTNSDVAMDDHGSVLLRGQANLFAVPSSASLAAVYGYPMHRKVVFRLGAQFGVLIEAKSRSSFRSFLAPDQSSRVVGFAADGGVVIVSDTEDGSYIDHVTLKGHRRSLAAFNRHFAKVKKPTKRTIAYSVGNSNREGMLWFPTANVTKDAPPVIVTAYPLPGPLPSDGGSVGGVNEPYAYYFAPFLAAGYAVFQADFRIPSQLPSSVSVKQNVLSEVLPAIDAIAEEISVDGTRLGFAGHSYGGYTALTLLAHTNRLKAIAAYAPLGDLAEYSYSQWPESEFSSCRADLSITAAREVEDPGNNDAYAFLRMDAHQSGAPSKYLESSPSLNLGAATTPTLLAFGEFDSFANGARSTYLALTRLGVPSSLLTFYGEGHIVQSPGNIVTQCVYSLRWFNRFLSGRDSPGQSERICGQPN